MKQNQFEFKLFDQVLVRDNDNDKWYPAFYRRHNERDPDFPHVCDNMKWKQCIPYNDETKHLANTSNPYESKQKEIKYEVTFGFGKNLTVESFNEMEFKRFIGTAVCHNKDVKDFTVNMIIPD